MGTDAVAPQLRLVQDVLDGKMYDFIESWIWGELFLLTHASAQELERATDALELERHSSHSFVRCSAFRGVSFWIFGDMPTRFQGGEFSTECWEAI